MNVTISCREVREELGAVLDGEAPSATRDAVAGHLVGCAACRAEEQALREAQCAVSRLPVPPLPADFTARTVERALAAQQAQRAKRIWLRRLGEGLRRTGRFLLGPADPAPTAFGHFLRSALAGGMTMAGLSLMSAYVLANAWCCEAAAAWLVPRASYDAVRSFPLWNALVTLPPHLTITLVSLPLLLMALVGLRCLRPRALIRAFRAEQRLETEAVAAFALGALALTAFVGVFLVGVVEIVTVAFESYPRYQVLTLLLPWLVRAAIGGVAVGTLVLLAARCTRGVTALALAFYAVLVCAFVADQGVATATAVLGSVQANLEHVAMTIAGASPRSLWQAVLGLPALGGFFMGVLLSLLAWRTARRGVLVPGGLVALALAAALALGGWQVRHRLETRWQLGQTLKQAAGLELRPAAARSALVLFNGPFEVPGNGRLALEPARGMRMPAVYRQPVPWVVLGDNYSRLTRFLAVHPHSLLAGETYQTLIEDARAQWDEALILQLRLRYAESQAGQPWEASSLLWDMIRATPNPLRLAEVRALADPSRFVAVDPRVRWWLADALDRQGDPAAAQLVRARVDAATTRLMRMGKPPARAPITVTDGEVSGRLLLDGRPLASAPIRLMSARDRYQTAAPHPPLSRLLEIVASDLTGPANWGESDSLCAARTDAEGRFHFRSLADATYVPAVLIYADLSGWSGRVENAPGVVTIAPGHTRAELGEIRLTLRPGAAEAQP